MAFKQDRSLTLCKNGALHVFVMAIYAFYIFLECLGFWNKDMPCKQSNYVFFTLTFDVKFCFDRLCITLQCLEVVAVCIFWT